MSQILPNILASKITFQIQSTFSYHGGHLYEADTPPPPPNLLPTPVKKDMIPRPGRCFCSVMLLNSLLIDKNRAENVKLIHGKTTGRICVSLARPVLSCPHYF